MRRHRDDVGGKGFAWLCRATRWKCNERHCGGSALICSGRRRRSPAKPRDAKEEICFARRRDGNARLSLARRRTSAAWRRAAKEEQRNARTREGPATDRYAEALGSSAMTGNEPMRRGVEQPSWDRLRMATAQTRYATSGDGKVTHCSVMAKQSRGMQRRWTDTGSEGVALRSRAWRRQSEAWQGEGMARQRFDRRRLWNAMQRNETSWLSGTRGKASRPRAVHGDGVATRRSAIKREGSAMQRQRVALMRRGVAQPRMAGA